MHLVVDDQAPVARAEQVEVGERAVAAGRQHLVGRDRDRPDLLALARVFADLVSRERGAGDQLALPLPPGDRVGDQDQRGRPGLGHGRRPDKRLAGAAGEHHDAGAAGPELLHRLALVGPQVPVVFGQRDRVLLAVDVTGQVFGRPAELEQRLLEPPALGPVHRERVVVDPGAEHAGQLLALGHLDQDHPVERVQDQPVGGVVDQLQAPVAVHGLGHVDEQRMRHRIAGEPQQGVDHRLRVVPRGARVPQTQGRQPVRVDVLG